MDLTLRLSEESKAYHKDRGRRQTASGRRNVVDFNGK
jgi:hypothetical protein